MRRWIVFIVLAGIVLAVAGAACSSSKSGGTKPTATATVEEQQATSTPRPAEATNTAPPAPTDTPVPPAPTQPPPQQEQPTQPPPAAENCDRQSYPDVCIPPYPPDLDCGDVPFRRFTVRPPDPHGFDRDGDGIGCES